MSGPARVALAVVVGAAAAVAIRLLLGLVAISDEAFDWITLCLGIGILVLLTLTGAVLRRVAVLIGAETEGGEEATTVEAETFRELAEVQVLADTRAREIVLIKQPEISSAFAEALRAANRTRPSPPTSKRALRAGESAGAYLTPH